MPLCSIVILMFICGALGGSINFFLLDEEPGDAKPWWQHAVIGIGASFMVPLFLNMISSGLIDQIQGSSSQPPDYSKLLVLAGFCLVAAISSRAFITSMSDRVLREVKAVKHEAAKAQEEAAAANATMETFIERDDENGDAFEANAQSDKALADLVLSDDELAVMYVMSNSSFAMRSLSGISRQANLEQTRTNVAITSLMDKSLIAQSTSQKGYPRWYLTTAGRMHVGKK
jgi:hypothetical protein